MMQKTKRSQTGVSFLSPVASRFQLHIPISMQECETRLQRIKPNRTLIISGSTQVNLVPVMNMQRIKVHLLRRVGFTLEAELVAMMKPEGDHKTVIEGVARLPAITVLMIVLYWCIVPASIVYMLSWQTMTVRPDFICLPFVFGAWIVPLMLVTMRAWFARQFLIDTLVKALEVK